MENSNFLKKKLISIMMGAFLIIGLLSFLKNKKSQESIVTNVDSVQSAASAGRQSVKSSILVTEPTVAPVMLSAEKKKWQELQEIVQSKNDNDPRLDQDFKTMNDELHDLLRKKYSDIPLEDRSERGLIAFLIARDLKNNQDLEFLKQIYEESPCLSLEDCKAKSADEPHLAGIDQSSMNYPQLVALYQLEKQLNSNAAFFSDRKIRETTRALLDQAAQFPVQGVKERAARLKEQFRL